MIEEFSEDITTSSWTYSTLKMSTCFFKILMMPVSETEVLIAGGINVNSGCIFDTKKKRKKKITCDYLKTDQSSAFHIIGENKFTCL